MKLSDETKTLIEKEYEDFKKYMYANSPKEIRDQLGQFFTPASLSIKMLEAYDIDTFAGHTIIDPTSGSGNLLAAMLIAGADSDKILGNDYDPRMVKACRERLNKVCDMLGKPHIQDWQIHRGDATDIFCLTEFGPDYKYKLIEHYYNELAMPSFYTPSYEEMLSWLSNEQKEFLKEVD